ncbi:hypothetical protein C2845_PM12G13970 [Panicum miliaceum]|uniref:Uncharacterized protein n=1 Tax=Panicum miliaceum TaxID=4540 RepID=A0A3L6QC21_PANMI|nr:hypothetical protein C2845_PM12G13970 [Panicum miliaceum]
MRRSYTTWTLLKVHSQHYYGEPCRESAPTGATEASLFMNAQQKEEWLVAVVISVPDERSEIQEVKRKLRKTLREKAILEAQLRGNQEVPPEYDNDESIDYLPESPPRKRVHYGEPGYHTRYR